nr:macro domain-containing protein [Clostridium cibarium]
MQIKVGDIFSQEGLKVIGVNEYFDNIVDNAIISKNSLHGRYIMNNYENTVNLDKEIEMDSHLMELKSGYNNERKIGKKQKYKLGSIFVDGEYLLTSFAKFDDKNRAYLYMNDYINFLLNFWNEIDIIYSGRSVTIPLFGSGITRFKEYDHITDQELLELLIWSFKLSRIKFKYPASATIIIHKDKADKINFTKLKGWE